MKRLTYISRLVSDDPERDLRAIEEVSQRNNARDSITGVLIYAGGYFFQLIEGDEAAIDALYAKLLRDPRHTDLILIQTELDVHERLFPTWAMEVFNLDRRSEDFILPLRLLLQTLIHSHQIIERYTQPAVAHMIAQGLNPLTVAPKRVERVVLFGDIMGFTTLTETLGVDEVFTLVGRYLDLCTEVIERNGGEVSKFIGDSVMAYFPVEKADAALESALEILDAVRQVREAAPPESALRLLYTGFGLACGPVLEGNVGTIRKLDYTVLGDTVNVASRLQNLTRTLRHQILLTAHIRDWTTRPWPFVELGEQQIRGKETPIAVVSLDDPRACCMVTYEVWRGYLDEFLAQRESARTW